MSKVPFIIHFHNAFHAGKHFDLRIKYPDKNKLASFAIPKEKFPKGPGSRSIAIKVNDHSMAWLNKDNVKIPKGEYGGGFLKILQRGTANIIFWNEKAIVFEIEGEFADGRYYLFNTGRKKGSGRGKSEIWIILQKKEKEEIKQSDVMQFLSTQNIEELPDAGF